MKKFCIIIAIFLVLQVGHTTPVQTRAGETATSIVSNCLATIATNTDDSYNYLTNYVAPHIQKLPSKMQDAVTLVTNLLTLTKTVGASIKTGLFNQDAKTGVKQFRSSVISMVNSLSSAVNAVGPLVGSYGATLQATSADVVTYWNVTLSKAVGALSGSTTSLIQALDDATAQGMYDQVSKMIRLIQEVGMQLGTAAAPFWNV